MSNLNTNYENMKKYKFETFIKKSNLNMKIPVWNMTYEKYQAPLSYWLLLCSVRSRVPWPLVNWNFGPGCISGQKHQGSDETPLGRMQQTPCGLSPWADGRGNVVNRVAVVMIPVRPGTLTTATRVTQHTQHSAQGLSPQGIGTTPGGCQQTPNASTTEATWARV